jgi:hypothetical protein
MIAIVVATEDNGTGFITTVLTVTSLDGLNGSNISCGESARATGDGIQETTAVVFGEYC